MCEWVSECARRNFERTTLQHFFWNVISQRGLGSCVCSATWTFGGEDWGVLQKILFILKYYKVVQYICCFILLILFLSKTILNTSISVVDRFWPPFILHTEMISPSLSGTGSSYHILSISSFYIKSINIKAITPSVKHNIIWLIKPQAISPDMPGQRALAW